MLKLFAFCVELPTLCWNNPWWAARCPFHWGRLLKRTVPPWGMSTMNSSLLTSKTFGFFTLIPCKQHQLELSSIQSWALRVHDGNPAAFHLIESSSQIWGHFPVTWVLQKLWLCSFCTSAAQHHPGSNHHQAPGNGPFTPGWASRRCCFVLPNLRGVFLPEKCTTFR